MDELDKALHQKARNRVKKCRVSARMRGETTRGLGIALAHRKSKFLPAATAELRRRMRAAWWLSDRLVWGKRKRTERGISRGRRRGKGSSKSLVIVRIKSAVSCRGRDLGKNVSAGVMTGGSHLSATASESAGRWAAGGLVGYACAADSQRAGPISFFFLK